MDDLISRQTMIDALAELQGRASTKVELKAIHKMWKQIKHLPSAQPEYEPVTAEDFAKIMSEVSPYNFVAWHQEALTLMKEQGFVICKKTI
jgi:hypothetical protein